ncbi:MAG: hypothetical protein JWN45_283, partial [Acidobacteriaceae bacterium]|nr:hypothetical protein [Acidobacteriaceae bacterium]
RAYFGAFILLTSFYCLLAYIPFTYHWFIQTPLVFWFPIFVRFHAYFFLSAVAAVGATMQPYLRDPKTRRLAIGFLVFNFLAAIALVLNPFLSHLPNDYRSFIWSLLTLFPLAWLTLLDLISSEHLPARAESPPFSPLPAVLAALLVTTIYAAIGAFKAGALLGRAELSAIPWSFFSHLVVLVSVFVVLQAVFLLVRRFAPEDARTFALNLVGFIAGAILLRKLVLATLGFNNWWADIYAIAFSGVFVGFLHTMRARYVYRSSSDDERALDEKPLARVFYALWPAALIAIAVFTPMLIGTMDWNFLLQKLAAVAVWAGAFAFFYRFTPANRSGRPAMTLLLLAAMCFVGYKTLTHAQSKAASALDRYAGYDISFKVARDILTPALDDESYRSFYDFLQQNTGLAESAKVGPVDIKLVDRLEPTNSEKPNIFIFVVDSLRQDYLGAYNNAVTFTPAIDSFAHESVVMEKAFSRYGGTVLSEPAIWTGSMQLHKQYIQPFYPMNSLQKLLDTDGYESWITMDPVLDIILRKSGVDIKELDKNPAYWTDYDLNRTLKEIESKLDNRAQTNKPLFVYSQPQNLHTVTLFRLSNKRPPKKDYSGFHRVYASEVERMDQGFGEFIQYLKARNLYDKSIIVLTSDHGDSLGEFGRWGHGSTMFPEILRVPLIIHLPSKLQKNFYWDSKQVAFSMDVTPSLYYLLGHRPIRNDEMLGRPLFTETKEEHDQYLRDSYLLVSSYGPVYARLANNGGELFIVDAAAHKNYLYNLADDPQGTHNLVSIKKLTENERFIRQHVSSIGRFYNFPQADVLAVTH